MFPLHTERHGGRFAGVLAACLWLTLVVQGAGAQGSGAQPPDPLAPKPERPTVATHAYVVAPGIVELEAGAQYQRPEPGGSLLSTPTVFKIGLCRRAQLDIAPGWARSSADGRVESAPADLQLAVKWHLADGLPLLADVAVQTTLKLPTGTLESGGGTNTTDVAVMFISSRSLGPVGLDLNVGYTRRSGSGAEAPVNATVWAAAVSLPVAGAVGWSAEVFGYPGTAGPAGAGPAVGFITGPSLKLGHVVLDAGAVLNVTGLGATAAYAGLTWNLGFLPGAHRPEPAPPRS
jgi:hypothetical protein